MAITSEKEQNHVNGFFEREADEIALLDEIISIVMKEAVVDARKKESKVVNFKFPEQLEKEFDLTIHQEPESKENLKEICRKTIKYSIKTGHPRFMNQFFQDLNPMGLAGLFITNALNTSVYTYEMGPVFTFVEKAVIAKMASLVGYETFDGIFCPGGSMCNMYAMNLARFKLNPDFKTKGIQGSKQLVIFTSDSSHYSITKGAAFLGIGTDNICIIKTDESGKIIPKDLDEAITASKQKGEVPLIVCVTAGTTVYGAFDPLEEIADICEKHGIWMHVDAAWGGGFLLSRNHKDKMKGIERSDSVTWCLHKMMGTPLQCSGFILNNKGNILNECHSSGAKYLFQKDKFYDVSYDTGDKSIQCSRLPDAFKAWFLWKGKGDLRLEQEADLKFEIARYCADAVNSRDGFQLLLDPECTNVLFWYVPPCLRNQEKTPEYWERLGKVAPIIKRKMVLDGGMMITYQPHLDKVNFFKVIIANPNIQRHHIDLALDEIDRFGRDIVV